MNLPGGAPRAVAVAVAALVLAGGAALLVLDDDSGEQQVATDATTSTTEEPTTTTALVVTTTTLVPTTVPPTVATAPPTTTATTRPTTTTTKGPTRTWSISPTSGPSGTQGTASGVGCTGTNAGVTLRFYDPSGEEYDGNGAAAQPDGTWSVPFSMTGAPGRYRITAECSGSNGFRYTAPQYFTIT